MQLRTILIGSALLLSAVLAHGQDRDFSVSVQAGPVFSTIKPDLEGVFDPKFRIGFFAGASLNLALSERWEIPLEVQFSQRGFHYNTEAAFIFVDNQIALFRGRVDYRLSYLDLAPKVEFRPIRALGIAVGPYLSVQLSESVRYEEVIEWTSTKDNALFEDIDFGLSAKLSGYLGPVSLFVAYQYGLANISNLILTDDNGQDLGRLGAKNRAVLVGLGWRI